VWICGWIFDYQMEDGTCIISHSQEDRLSEVELLELAAEYECPVVLDDTPMGRPAAPAPSAGS
jgi:hypothetical protein